MTPEAWLRPTIIVLLISTVFAGWLAAFSGAAAASTPPPDGPSSEVAPTGEVDRDLTFGIQPSAAEDTDERAVLTWTATPGSTLTDYVAITNFAEEPLSLSMYAADAFNTEDGGFDLLAAGEPSTDIATWVTLDRDTVVLEPRGRVIVPVTLRVPADATPGDHAGGVVVSLRTTGLDEDGNQVSVDNRVGTRMYLRVAGATKPELTLDDLSARFVGGSDPGASGTADIAYSICNSGNIRLAGASSVGLAGWFGASSSGIVPPKIDELLPKNCVQIATTVEDVPAAIRLEADVTLLGTPPEDADETIALPPIVESTDFWAVPWFWIAIAAAILLLLLLLLFLRRRRGRQVPPQGSIAPPTPSESRELSTP